MIAGLVLAWVMFMWPAAPALAAKRVADVYPGAVPAVVGKLPNGQPHPCDGRCFLTKDPIEKVKAFYEKKLGALTAGPFPYGQQGYSILLEYARSEEGFAASEVEIFSLSPARPHLPKDNRKRGDLVRMGGASWGAALGAMHPLFYATDWGDGSLELGPAYKPADVVAVYDKFSHLNSYFFVRDAKSGKNRAEQLTEQLLERLARLKQDSMMGNLASQQAISQAANREGDKIAAQDAQDDPEFNRIMQRKPALQKKYVELTQKTQQQMMSGQMEEAEKTMDESDRLLRSDKEMAALMRRYDERDKQREAVSAKTKAQSGAAESDALAQLAKKRWELAVQTLNAVAKEGYSTYFIVDYALEGKGVERDRAKLRAMNSGPLQGVADMEEQASNYRRIVQEQGLKIDGQTPEQVAAAREAIRNKHGGNLPASAAAPKPAEPTQQQAAQSKPEEKNDVQKAAKKGLNLLKKLF